jgi:hypothetical protein
MVEIIITILSSAVKFAVTFPLAIMQFEFGFWETVCWTNVGGILGIYFFAFISGKLISWWNRTFRKSHPHRVANGSSDRKIFTKRNRRIVRIKKQYGLIGIAISTPFLLSIPVGAFLVVRYYRASKKGFLYLFISNVIWSIIYTGFYLFWNTVIFRPS